MIYALLAIAAAIVLREFGEMHRANGGGKRWSGTAAWIWYGLVVYFMIRAVPV